MGVKWVERAGSLLCLNLLGSFFSPLENCDEDFGSGNNRSQHSRFDKRKQKSNSWSASFVDVICLCSVRQDTATLLAKVHFKPLFRSLCMFDLGLLPLLLLTRQCVNVLKKMLKNKVYSSHFTTLLLQCIPSHHSASSSTL